MLSKYRASTHSPDSVCLHASERTSVLEHQVVSGLYAWNEDMPRAEIGPTKGKATPMPETAEDRLIRLWASPQGAPKAAIAAASRSPEGGPTPTHHPDI